MKVEYERLDDVERFDGEIIGTVVAKYWEATDSCPNSITCGEQTFVLGSRAFCMSGYSDGSVMHVYYRTPNAMLDSQG